MNINMNMYIISLLICIVVALWLLRPVNEPFFTHASGPARAAYAVRLASRAATTAKDHARYIGLALKYGGQDTHNKYITAICMGNKWDTNADGYSINHARWIRYATFRYYKDAHNKYIDDLKTNDCTAHLTKMHDKYISDAAKLTVPHEKYIADICSAPAAPAASCIINKNEPGSFEKLEEVIAKYYVPQ